MFSGPTVPAAGIPSTRALSRSQSEDILQHCCSNMDLSLCPVRLTGCPHSGMPCGSGGVPAESTYWPIKVSPVVMEEANYGITGLDQCYQLGFTPPLPRLGTFGTVWRYFWLSQLGSRGAPLLASSRTLLSTP